MNLDLIWADALRRILGGPAATAWSRLDVDDRDQIRKAVKDAVRAAIAGKAATPSPSVPAPIQSLKCPDCGGKMAPRTSEHGKFWGCADYPKCRGTRDWMGLSKAERDERTADLEEGSEDAPHHFGRWDR